MDQSVRSLRGLIFSALLPTQAVYLAAACGGHSSDDASGGAGRASVGAAGGTPGTQDPDTAGHSAAGTAAGAGTSGAVAGTGGATGGSGGVAGGSGGVTGGSGGVTGGSGGVTGGSGGATGGGSSENSGGGRNCVNPGPGVCCDYDRCMSPEEAAAVVRLASGTGGAGNAPQGGAGGETASAGESATAPLCPEIRYQYAACGFYRPGVVEKDGQCCYVVNSGGCCGRPFIVAGEARQSQVALREDWSAARSDMANLAEVDSSERQALAQAWVADALLEHASIASFARFTLELLSAGAPAHLVQAAQQAGLDEVHHAQACFALASRFAGQALGPTALPTQGVALAQTPAALAVAVLREGCIGETLAAAVARAQLAVVGDAACRAALELIARDEAEHSLLAWRVARHSLELGGAEVVDALRAAKNEATPTARLGADPVTRPDLWNHFGRLTPEQEQAVLDETWREVIEPALSLLLRGTDAAVVPSACRAVASA
jgi:hypothetical protein